MILRRQNQWNIAGDGNQRNLEAFNVHIPTGCKLLNVSQHIELKHYSCMVGKYTARDNRECLGFVQDVQVSMFWVTLTGEEPTDVNAE